MLHEDYSCMVGGGQSKANTQRNKNILDFIMIPTMNKTKQTNVVKKEWELLFSNFFLNEH